MRAWALRIHAWLGLTVGFMLAVLGLSGAVLVLRPSLEARTVPMMNVVPGSSKASWQAIYDNASKASQNKVEHVFVSRQPDRAHEIWTKKGAQLFYVDPYSAKVLGAREPERDFWGWTMGLHTKLLTGDVGHSVVGWGGFALVILGATGLVLWWPRGNKHQGATWKRAIAMKWRGALHVKAFEWHRVAGFFASGLFFVSGATGVTLVWSETAASAFARAFNISAQAKPKAESAGAWRSLDELVRTSSTRFPQAQLRRISFPAKKGAPLSIRFQLPGELHPNGMNTVFLDPSSGAVVKVQDTRVATPDQRAMFLRYPLHIGEWGGWFSKILLMLAGLSLPAFWLTGVLLWLRKRKPARRNIQRSASRTATKTTTETVKAET